jgi:hypothetical protein
MNNAYALLWYATRYICDQSPHVWFMCSNTSAHGNFSYLCSSHALIIELYSAFVLFEQANVIDWVHVRYILSLSLTEYSLTWYSCHMLRVELWETSCKSSLPHVDRTYQKGKSRDDYILLLLNSKYKRRWINMIVLQDKHNINTVSWNIKCMCYRHKTWERLCEPHLYLSFFLASYK